MRERVETNREREQENGSESERESLKERATAHHYNSQARSVNRNLQTNDSKAPVAFAVAFDLPFAFGVLVLALLEAASVALRFVADGAAAAAGSALLLVFCFLSFFFAFCLCFPFFRFLPCELPEDSEELLVSLLLLLGLISDSASVSGATLSTVSSAGTWALGKSLLGPIRIAGVHFPSKNTVHGILDSGCGRLVRNVLSSIPTHVRFKRKGSLANPDQLLL